MRPFGGRSSLPLRGGNWMNTSASGVFALNLNNPRANSSNNIGFRAAFLSSQIPEAHGPRARAERQKGLASVPIRRSAKNKTVMEAASSPVKTRARAVTHEPLFRERVDASFARRLFQWQPDEGGRVRAQPSKPARDLQRYSWFPRRFSLRPDTRSLRAPGQSRETKGARFRADRQGRQKIQASWTPPVTRGAPG